MKGIITEIERFALKDGPGIRTTVFFKGCNMACKWCHNPETLSVRPQLMIYPDKCIGCGACVEACRAGARTLGKNGALQYDRTACKHCGACAANCFSGALVMSGKEMTVEEVMEEILQDRAYYRNSGGGVTLSGGEVMASQHMDYVEEVCRKLHENGVSIFIDTSGYTDYKNLKRILPYVDVFLYDIKVMDPEDHKKYIGVDNSLILENLKKLSDEGAGLYIRLPIIQQVNATDEHIESVIHFLKENNIHARQVNLLPYHDIGKGKYASLDMEYHDDEMSVPVSELMEHFKSMFEEQGFNKVNIGG